MITTEQLKLLAIPVGKTKGKLWTGLAIMYAHDHPPIIADREALRVAFELEDE